MSEGVNQLQVNQQTFFNGAHGLFEELGQHAGGEIGFKNALIVHPVKSQKTIFGLLETSASCKHL